jgi:hypothetical protein
MDPRLRLLGDRLKELDRDDLRRLAAGGLVIVLTFGLGLGLGMLVGHGTHPRATHAVASVRVPDVIGRPSAGAIALLHLSGLRVRLERIRMADDRLVVWQDPAAGKRVAPGTVVLLQVRCLVAPCS